MTKFKSHFPEWRLDSFPGFLGNVTAGRCTNVFNLDGMNCVVDAACASSLVAVKVAIDELLHGDCNIVKVPPLAVPQLAPCAFSGRA